MKFFVYFAEMRISNMGINLRSGDISMAKHGLNRTKIGAVHEEIGGKRMTKRMWSDVLGDAS